ncbi:MAG: cytochrome c1 [Alphaproteobacteria bacterium]|nr:cytochrome c1 [Alphaproteobacteria bacterium]
MIKAKTILMAIALAGLFSAPANASGTAGVEPKFSDWTFGGLFGTYDEHQLQRGFQVFREVCAACHSANLISFRNLSEEGGLNYSESQVKALAAEYTIADPASLDGERSGIPADRWPAPFATEQDARDANNGALPPDFSVLAKARTVQRPGLGWIMNYFIAYQEGGPDYVYNLMTNYAEAPHDVEIPAGQYYNAFFGGGIAMAPPLADGLVTYDDASVPMTTEQYAKDVSAFMMWMAEPHLIARKELGFKVLIILSAFAVLMYLTKRKLWSNVKH